MYDENDLGSDYYLDDPPETDVPSNKVEYEDEYFSDVEADAYKYDYEDSGFYDGERYKGNGFEVEEGWASKVPRYIFYAVFLYIFYGLIVFLSRAVQLFV